MDRLNSHGATDVAVEEARQKVVSAAAGSIAGEETTLMGVAISPEDSRSCSWMQMKKTF